MLAGIIPAPELLSPFRDPSRQERGRERGGGSGRERDGGRGRGRGGEGREARWKGAAAVGWDGMGREREQG